MASVQHFSSVLFLLMILAGLWSLVVDRMPFCVPCGPYLKIVWAFTLFWALIALSLINAEDLPRALKILGNMAYFLALLPLFYFGQKISGHILNSFVWGLVVAGPINLAMALWKVFALGFPRAKGFYNPIIFGDLMILGALLLLVCLCVGHFQSRVSSWVAGFSLSCLLLASYLSGTRGAWSALPFILILILGLFRHKLNKRKFIYLLLVFSLLTGLLFSAANLGLRAGSRSLALVPIKKNILLYFHEGRTDNNIGVRFAMWKIAWDMFKQHPVLGVGLGGFSQEFSARNVGLKIAPGARIPHAHSIYFEFLATTGLPGFLAMLTCLFIVPGWFFKRALSGTGLQRLSGSLGLVFLLCFALFGLTECWLFRSPMLISYIVGLLIFTSSCFENTESALSSPGGVMASCGGERQLDANKNQAMECPISDEHQFLRQSAWPHASSGVKCCSRNCG
jgi:O-antigen ligase